MELGDSVSAAWLRFTTFFSTVWTTMASPSWFANTGVPLLVAVAGLAVAVMLVRRQLASDRKLRVADRRQEVAGRLGAALNESLLKLKRTPAEDPWWETLRWPDEEYLRYEVAEASIHLTAAKLADVTSLVDDFAAAWQVCLITAYRMKPHPDTASHRAGVIRATSPYSEALKRSSVELRLWDGMGSMPQSLSALSHISATYDQHFTTEATSSWRADREADYLGSGAGLTLVKPSKQRLWTHEDVDEGHV